MDEEKKLTIKEVMKITGAARPTVNRWCSNGKLPNAVKIITPVSSYWLIPESDLEGLPEVKMGRPRKHD